MTLSAILLILPVAALIVSFLQVLSKPEEDKRKWKITIFFSAALLCINALTDIGKRISDFRQEVIAKQRESEQRKMFTDVMLDIKSLNNSANLAFERLDNTIKFSSPSAMGDLRKEAATLHSELGTITELVTRTTPDFSVAEQLKIAAKEIHADVAKLNSGIDAQQTKESEHPFRPAERQPPDDGSQERRTQQLTGLQNTTAGNSPSADLARQITGPLDLTNNTSSTVGAPLPLFVNQPTPDRWIDGLDSDPYSLLNAIREGAVTAAFLGTGNSSGESVEVRISRPVGSVVPTLKDYVLPPGSRLRSSNAAESNMTIRAIAGISVDKIGYRYQPTSVITVPGTGATTYVLDAFDIDFHKESPTSQNHFTLHTPEPVLSCIAKTGRSLSTAAFQAAVWMFTDRVTFSEVNAQFDVSNREWQQGEAVFTQCQSLDRK